MLKLAELGVTWPLHKSKVRTKDPMYGFSTVRRCCLDQITFQRAGFKLLLEVLVRSRICSVEEFPFAFGLRYREASKANFKVT